MSLAKKLVHVYLGMCPLVVCPVLLFWEHNSHTGFRRWMAKKFQVDLKRILSRFVETDAKGVNAPKLPVICEVNGQVKVGTCTRVLIGFEACPCARYVY